jgi:hypothetical protein
MPPSRRAAAMVGAVADDPVDVSGACAANRGDRPGARRATVIRTVKRRTGGGPPGDESEMPGMNLVVGIPYGVRRLGFHRFSRAMSISRPVPGGAWRFVTMNPGFAQGELREGGHAGLCPLRCAQGDDGNSHLPTTSVG